jgi:hypothetical protein
VIEPNGVLTEPAALTPLEFFRDLSDSLLKDALSLIEILTVRISPTETARVS